MRNWIVLKIKLRCDLNVGGQIFWKGTVFDKISYIGEDGTAWVTAGDQKQPFSVLRAQYKIHERKRKSISTGT